MQSFEDAGRRRGEEKNEEEERKKICGRKKMMCKALKMQVDSAGLLKYVTVLMSTCYVQKARPSV